MNFSLHKLLTLQTLMVCLFLIENYIICFKNFLFILFNNLVVIITHLLYSFNALQEDFFNDFFSHKVISNYGNKIIYINIVKIATGVCKIMFRILQSNIKL